ncbi:hypothetical protein EB796_000960 [Bugula neritina]|uniref:Uncharacterized protein n=1 Tax=Bugula neritina TaxID=10212 RepID=A0A7J7KRI2_BUGNE|nr:hypothetical protein EB796_000960 [Bugula neritina]
MSFIHLLAVIRLLVLTCYWPKFTFSPTGMTLTLFDLLNRYYCPDDATKCLETAIQLLSTNLGTKHGSVHKVKVRLAKVVAASSDLDRAKTILTEILENFDAATYYMDWYNEMYELLIFAVRVIAMMR